VDSNKVEVKVNLTLGIDPADIEKLLSSTSDDKLPYHLVNAMIYGCKLSGVQVRGISLDIPARQG
jgi:hypothetical protein